MNHPLIKEELVAAMVFPPPSTGLKLREFVQRVEGVDDADPSNTSDVLWAIGTRCDPATSIEVAHFCWSTPIDPRIGPDERQRRNFTSSRGIIDVCKPFPSIKEFPPTSTITQQDFEETTRNWGAILSTNK